MSGRSIPAISGRGGDFRELGHHRIFDPHIRTFIYLFIFNYLSLPTRFQAPCGRAFCLLFTCVFVFYCYVTIYHNYYEFSALQQHHSLPHSSVVQKSGGTWLDSLLTVLQNQNQGVSQPGWALIQRLWGEICFQAHSDCWQNSVLCSRRTKAPNSLLALSRGHSHLLEAALTPCHVTLSIVRQAEVCQILLTIRIFVASASATSWIKLNS